MQNGRSVRTAIQFRWRCLKYGRDWAEMLMRSDERARYFDSLGPPTWTSRSVTLRPGEGASVPLRREQR